MDIICSQAGTFLPDDPTEMTLTMQSLICTKNAIYLVGLLALTACTTPPRPVYQPPGPLESSARLLIVPGSIGRHDNEILELRQVNGCDDKGFPQEHLFELARWESRREAETPVTVTVPVGQVSFQYIKNMNGKMCRMEFWTRLDAGRSYRLNSDIDYKGFFQNNDCVLHMVDTDSGEPVVLSAGSAIRSDTDRSTCPNRPAAKRR